MTPMTVTSSNERVRETVSHKPKIKVCKYGPYSILGAIPLFELTVSNDAEDCPCDYRVSKRFPLQEDTPYVAVGNQGTTLFVIRPTKQRTSTEQRPQAEYHIELEPKSCKGPSLFSPMFATSARTWACACEQVVFGI